MKNRGSAGIAALIIFAGIILVATASSLVSLTEKVQSLKATADELQRAGSGGGTVIRDPSVSPPITVSNGGTGVSSLNQGGVLFSDGATVLQNANFVLDNDSPKLGFGTTAPFGLVSIEALLGQAGSGTPVLFVGSSGTSSPLFQIKATGRVEIATDTDNGAESSDGTGFNVGTSTTIAGGFNVIDGTAATGETPTTTPGDALIAGFLRLLGGIGTQCRTLSSGYLDMNKGNCFEYSTTTDGAIRVIPRNDGLMVPVRLKIYHDETSGNSEQYFVNNQTQGTTTYTPDTGTSTPWADTAAGVDLATLWYDGTSTTNAILNVVVNKNILPGGGNP